MQSSLLFTGAHISRPKINLGGQNGGGDGMASGSQDLVKRARREREEREEKRKKERAATKLQAFYRGRQSASKTRIDLRQRYDEMLAANDSVSTLSASRILKVTSLFLLFFTDNSQGDLKRAGKWCRIVLGNETTASPKPTPWLFALFRESNWPALVNKVIAVLFKQASRHPVSISQTPLFLEMTKIVCDPSSYVKWSVRRPEGASRETASKYLIRHGYYDDLRTLILGVPTESQSHPALTAAIGLALLPFKTFPNSSVEKPAKTVSGINTTKTLSKMVDPEKALVLVQFSRCILTIPFLMHRLPNSAMATLMSKTPFEDLFEYVASDSFVAQSLEDRMPAIDLSYLLSNILYYTGSNSAKMLLGFQSSKVLMGYLHLLTMILNKLPVGIFGKRQPLLTEKVEKADKGKKVAMETIEIDDSEVEDDEDRVEQDEVVQKARARVGTFRKDADGDTTMDDSSTQKLIKTKDQTNSLPLSLDLDPHTRALLQLLPDRTHLNAVLVMSTRFASTTRPYLAAFIVSLLGAWPSKRDEIISAIMYGPSNAGSIANATQGAKSQPTTGVIERGGGLLREVWRGFIRAGPLSKFLGGERDRSSAVIQTLLHPTLAGDWMLLILLSELYTRCLLTLGDDEFYSTRNPLTLDEVTGLSGLLRNLAFALYWQEGHGPVITAASGDTSKVVKGTRVTFESLRTLATTLLQQVHARDSRRRFTPDNHWLMISQFDLASFIETAVYEDRKLYEGDDEGEAGEESVFEPRSHRLLSRRTNTILSKRQMAFISPRLGVLNNIPFVIPFETRVAIFRQFVANDRRRLGIEPGYFDRSRRQRAVVRRTHLSEDSFKQLNGLGAALKSRIEIVFVDEHGMEESGIDGGGLFKELLTSLSKEAFDTDRGLWLATQEQELYPNPHSYAKESAQLSWYSFIGRILGKALYEGILVDVRFAGFFLSKWLGRQSYLDDLASLDPELYNGLIFLKNYNGNVETDLSLNFTVTDDDFGVSRTIELIPGGSEVMVTSENRMKYILLTSNYRLNAQIEKQCSAFFSGLSEIIPERFLRMFNQAELRVLAGGVDEPIDLTDLKNNTVYGGWDGDEANDTIRAFWSVVDTFDREQRSKLVKFVTSCARPPLLGFQELEPKFAIRAAGKDETRLPTSSTCVNLLKLPQYQDPDNLKKKLLYAINSGAGFDLS